MVLNPKPSLLQPDDWSPNQVAKRDRIILAASRIMAREGVKACTARAVAKASGMSTSALHYYFRDIDEVNDLAFRRVIERYLAHLESVIAPQDDAVDALWAAACAYLERSTDPKSDGEASLRRAPMLWFEFHAESLRTGNMATVRELSARGATFFIKLVGRATGESDVEAKAESLYCGLLGASIRNSLLERPVEAYVGELMASLGLPTPARQRARGAARPARKARAAG